MFENNQPPQMPNPMSPLSPQNRPPEQSSGLGGDAMPSSAMPAPEPQTSEMSSAPKVYTMPEKFRSAGGGKSSGGRGGTRRLVIILVVVLVVAGLGVAGLFVFQNVFNQPANENGNLVVGNSNNNTNTTNENLNTNSDTNVNTNDSNLNTNSDTNVNTNVSNTNAATNTNTNIGQLPSSTDTDNDGLTDVEEVVYGTDSAKPDTDGDGFLDGKQLQTNGTYLGELYLGYNPAGTGRLEDASIVKRVNNSSNTYSVLIPNTWTTLIGQSGEIQITPAQATGEFFQVRINSNPTEQTPVEWFTSVSPNSDPATLKTDAFNGFEVLYNPDRSTAYLFNGTNVYSIEYETGALTQASYWTTFDMIVMNFKLIASSN